MTEDIIEDNEEARPTKQLVTLDDKDADEKDDGETLADESYRQIREACLAGMQLRPNMASSQASTDRPAVDALARMHQSAILCQPRPTSNCGLGWSRGFSHHRERWRGFRHELVIRVGRAKTGNTPFQALYNATDDLRLCAHCGKRARKMQRCTGCRWARYCSRTCQKAEWCRHEYECCPDRSLPAGDRTIEDALQSQQETQQTPASSSHDAAPA